MDKWSDVGCGLAPLKLCHILDDAGFLLDVSQFGEGIQTWSFEVEVQEHDTMAASDQEGRDVGKCKRPPHTSLVRVECGPEGFHFLAKRTNAKLHRLVASALSRL